MPTDQNDDETFEQDEQQQEPNWRRKLEAEAKAGREAQANVAAAQAERDQLQRELAMMKAGVDTSSPLGQMFAKSYDGETDVEAVRAEYSRIAGTGQPPVDQQAMARIGQALQGSAPSGGVAPDFESDLDSIPMIVDGNYNPDYVHQVLNKTQEQAAREGRQFNVLGHGASKWTQGSGAGPNTQPLK